MLTSHNWFGTAMAVVLLLVFVVILVVTDYEDNYDHNAPPVYNWWRRWCWLCRAWSHWARARNDVGLEPTSGWDCLRLTVAIWGPEMVGSDPLGFVGCGRELAWRDLGSVRSAEYSGRAFQYLVLVGWRWSVESTDTLP